VGVHEKKRINKLLPAMIFNKQVYCT